MDKVKVNGVNIAYYLRGQGEPLVLIRGYGHPAAMWYDQVPEWSRHFKVITFDNRDVGSSDRVERPYSIGDMAQDTIGLIQSLDLGPVHLLGISMGGMIAQQVAVSRPDLLKSLVLGCTTCNSTTGVNNDPEVIELFATLPHLSDEENVRRSLPVLFSPTTLRDKKELVDRYVRESLKHRPPLETFVRHSQALQGFDLCARLHRINIPTLIQHGSDDRLLPLSNAYQLKELIPHASLKIYQGLGHLFFMEDAPAYNRDVVEFITGLKA